MDGDGDACNSSHRNHKSAAPVAPSTSSSSSASSSTPKRQQSDNPDEDESRTEYSCPYCYEDYDVAVLCSHLEDEHCYESKVAVCPICGTKVWKDMAGHIMLDHSQLFKIQRRRRFRRSGALASNATLALLTKELREIHLQALLGPPPPSNTVDPFLTTLSDSSHASQSSHKRLEVAALSPEEQCDKLKEANLRVKFMQELVISTLFN
ncbi:protein DEHYDRATION-INDUCED 19 homolog 4 [Selaginella moellendorffii]|uniref:protein DEHYDRATION-INDUCED 19 homolog 4 n=1 Tax=Selaginella moellendorffii TaxID=88036 RepID=UPI000D1C5D07|nr:protein DEHYDRATION-INDUCED 19 homolog 4 [Selaginella moellendorffii]|eukprot:XP_024517321.1 protein DEHYDRATION-INDUCED 19 homolog 4 [Selaginella moellendorffii]